MTEMDESVHAPGMSRRRFLALVGAGGGALALSDFGLVEAARQLASSGDATAFGLKVAPMVADLGGAHAKTVGFNNMLPGPELRYTQGDPFHVRVANHLKTTTSVHWHGIPVPNQMDGVPGVTQRPIQPGTTFDYHYRVPVSGTYWYHSHSAAQSDRGLYGPLIIQPKNETLSYDRDYVLMLDDWKDGVGGRFVEDSKFLYECEIHEYEGSFKQLPHNLTAASSSSGVYPYYLITGRTAGAAEEFPVKRGDVIRLRIINTSAVTPYRVAMAGHKMRVVAADGQLVQPVTVDAFTIGMAERYDVLIQADNPGVWPVVAKPLLGGSPARALVRYQGSSAAAPPPTFAPRELRGRRLAYDMLHAASSVHLPNGRPDVTIPIQLETRLGNFFLGIPPQYIDLTDGYIHFKRNQHVRFVITNGGTVAPHPMHLHGHFFHLRNRSGRGPLKDTALVYPNQTVTIDWIANNPGLWVFHCHNLYHMLSGMMQTLKVA